MADKSAAPVVLVTGGNKGIGRATVELALSAGWNVAFTYNSDEAAATSMADLLRTTGRSALMLKADIGNQSAVRAAFETVHQKFGRLDGLVNNAGIIGAPRPITEASSDHLEAVFRTNVLGCFYCVAEATRLMSKRFGGNGGSIVNVSSAAARHGGMVNEVHYAASKGAIDSMTLALAKELGPDGIRVNSVRPGLIDTSIHEVHGGREFLSHIAPTVPLGRAGTPEEVAKLILFLLGPDSTYVHGALVDIAGGR